MKLRGEAYHGLAGSLEDWREFGYVAALRDEYQLILVDARGHGASEKPHAVEAHTTDQYARDIVAVLDDLGVATSHYWGYSQGGAVGVAAALLAPDRFRSFVIGGEDSWWTPASSTFDEAIGKLEHGLEPMIAWAEGWLGPWPPLLRARGLANDPAALIARFGNFHTDPGYRERLGEIRHPALIYLAEGDGHAQFAEQTADLMPNADYREVPGLNHMTAFTRSDLILPTVRSFLALHAGG